MIDLSGLSTSSNGSSGRKLVGSEFFSVRNTCLGKVQDGYYYKYKHCVFSDCAMWARIQHDRWTEEASKAKSATAPVEIKAVDDKRTESSAGVQAQLWVMQKMVTSTQVNTAVQGVFVQSVCKNTELNQFT